MTGLRSTINPRLPGMRKTTDLRIGSEGTRSSIIPGPSPVEPGNSTTSKSHSGSQPPHSRGQPALSPTCAIPTAVGKQPRSPRSPSPRRWTTHRKSRYHPSFLTLDPCRLGIGVFAARRAFDECFDCREEFDTVPARGGVGPATALESEEAKNPIALKAARAPEQTRSGPRKQEDA